MCMNWAQWCPALMWQGIKEAAVFLATTAVISKINELGVNGEVERGWG